MEESADQAKQEEENFEKEMLDRARANIAKYLEN